ncbi:MAG: hypothetical protein WKF77_06315 [Planctomycetaceae bacterium]
MITRFLVAFVAAAALTVFANVSLAFDAADGTHSAEFVSVKDGKLTTKDKDDKEHSHDVGEDVKVTCDGKECKIEELKKGYIVKVTIKDKKVIKIVAKTAN